MKKIIIVSLFFLIFGCKKSLEFDLTGDNIGIEEALNSPENLKALLNSCYDEFANQMDGNVQNLHELLGDNTIYVGTDDALSGAFNRSTFIFRTAGAQLQDLYNCIYRANVFKENLSRFSNELNVTELEGEALFLRAYCHWELVKLWAQPYGYTEDNTHLGIAVRTEANYVINKRSTVNEVYAQIIKDLEKAASQLPVTNTGYATQDAAKALLAKVYFTMNDFTNAEKYASEIINSGTYQFSDSLNRYKSNVASEIIFGTVSISNKDNRADDFIGKYASDNNPNGGIQVSTKFATSIDTGDLRSLEILIVNPGLPNEFSITNKFNYDFGGIPLLNLTDMYLIRSECIMTSTGGDKQTAVDDLNMIIGRAYADSSYRVTTSTITLDRVRLERRIEFAFEGDRTIQLKRRGVMGENIVIRGAPWDCPGMVLQFPGVDETDNFELNPTGGCN